MSSLRRWVLDIEWEWGAIDRWPARYAEEWSIIRDQDEVSLRSWLDQGKKKAATGRQVLEYLGHVMEGHLHDDIEEWRDLYTQGYQLAARLYSGIIGLEIQLYRAMSELNDSSL